ncbi:hypothetical protein MIMGU_mgv1a023939mg, partial [Erythranthe guttata]
MVDAIVSIVVERRKEKVRKEVNLVRGVENEIRSLSDDLKKVRYVLEDAGKKGLENTTYEMDDVLDEWNYSVLKFRIEQSSDHDVYVPPKKRVWSSFVPSPCLCSKKVRTRHEIALKIEQVKTRFDLILAEQGRFGFHEIKSHPNGPSLIDSMEVCGRKLESENLVSKLVGGGGRGEELGVCVLSIVGTGGLGKTTLAKLAYNNSRVMSCFQLRIWICVSDPFDEVGIANEIIVGARGSKPNTNQFERVLKCLKEKISGKMFLLVLDNVWTEDRTKWEPLRICLKGGGLGSRILVATRNERVVVMMGSVKNDIHHLGHLSQEECCHKCNGLPLAAKTLGSFLQFKNNVEAWDNVLNSEIWELEEVEDDLFPHLLLSYKELSPTLQRCFSYCFPKYTEIIVADIIRIWFAMGYLGYGSDWEVRGREYFDKLAMRSLFQDFSNTSNLDEEWIASFKMHDIIHDFAQFLRKNVGSRMRETNCQTCSTLLVSRVEKYRSLFLTKELYDPHLCDGLTSVSSNKLIEELPESMCNLRELESLNIISCGSLVRLPQGIHRLVNLKHLYYEGTDSLKQYHQGLAQLTSL